MDCGAARERLSTGRAGEDRALRGHVESCADCRREEEAQRLLTAALLERLPQHPASLALKRRVAEAAAAAPRRQALPRRALFSGALAAAAALVLVVAIPAHNASTRAALVAGAVDEHLSAVRGELPLSVVSSGIHEVKPWFTGKLDFAPDVSFGGNADFPLQGGAVARFLDRPAALLSFRRRSHVISLFVVSADGLPFPGGPPSAGAVHTLRGFHVLTWRQADLGYVLVSDLNPGELAELAALLAGAEPMAH